MHPLDHGADGREDGDNGAQGVLANVQPHQGHLRQGFATCQVVLCGTLLGA